MKEKESGEEREEEEEMEMQALPGQSVGFQSAGLDHTCI